MIKYHERHKKAVGSRLSRDSGNQYYVFNVQCLQSGPSTLGTHKNIFIISTVSCKVKFYTCLIPVSVTPPLFSSGSGS